jgi:hypothetical protein
MPFSSTLAAAASAHGERVRPSGVRQTCQAEPGAPGPALAVPRRDRPPLGRTCKVRPRPSSPVFRGAHGRLSPPTGRARPSGACPLSVPASSTQPTSGLLNPILRGYTLIVFSLLFSSRETQVSCNRQYESLCPRSFGTRTGQRHVATKRQHSTHCLPVHEHC